MKKKTNKNRPNNMNVTITESSINKFKELINLTLDMCKDEKEFTNEIEINFSVICNYYNFLLEQYFINGFKHDLLENRDRHELGFGLGEPRIPYTYEEVIKRMKTLVKLLDLIELI